MSGGALRGASDPGPERASPFQAERISRTARPSLFWCLQLHGVAVALDLAGAAIGQCCDDLGFHLGTGARRLILGFDGALAGGDEAIDGAQRRLVEAAGAGRRNGVRLGGGAAAAIGADDALLGDDALGGHRCGAVGVEGGCCLADHLDKDCRSPFDAVQGNPEVIFRQPVDDDRIFRSMRGGLVKQLDVHLGLANMHFGRAAVVVLRAAVRLHFQHALGPVRPYDQSIGCPGEAKVGQQQAVFAWRRRRGGALRRARGRRRDKW